jgi:hypothetical protein
MTGPQGGGWSDSQLLFLGRSDCQPLFLGWSDHPGSWSDRQPLFQAWSDHPVVQSNRQYVTPTFYKNKIFVQIKMHIKL